MATAGEQLAKRMELTLVAGHPDHFQDTAGIRLCPGLHHDLNIDQSARRELLTQDRQPPRIDPSMVGQAIGERLLGLVVS